MRSRGGCNEGVKVPFVRVATRTCDVFAEIGANGMDLIRQFRGGGENDDSGTSHFGFFALGVREQMMSFFGHIELVYFLEERK